MLSVFLCNRHPSDVEDEFREPKPAAADSLASEPIFHIQITFDISVVTCTVLIHSVDTVDTINCQRPPFNLHQSHRCAIMSEPPAPSTEPTQPLAEETTQPSQTRDEVDDDAEMEDAAEPTTTQQTSTEEDQPQDTILPPPQLRKDVTLREFLSKMDDYAPIIPDAVTAHYLTLAGLPPPSATDPAGERGTSTPLPLARLLALATQKFVADIAADAYQYSRIRAGNSGGAAAAAQPVPGAGIQGNVKGQAALGVQRAGFGTGGQGSAQGKTVLTMEDLGMAVQEYGINVKRGEFYR